MKSKMWTLKSGSFLCPGSVKCLPVAVSRSRFLISPVFLESVNQPSFCLTHILGLTYIAREAIDQVAAFARNITFGGVFPACGLAQDFSAGVQNCTVLAVFCGAPLGSLFVL